jgi:hypothetical protein
MDENHRVLELSATALARVYAQASAPGWRLDLVEVRHGDIVHMELSRVATNLVEAAEELYTALKNIENDDGHIPEALWEQAQQALAHAEGHLA